MTANILEIKDFNLKLSSLIEASAGTGKTYTISYLVLRLLLGSGLYNSTAHKDGPLSLDNILIVTFTEKATADLKARVREKIRYARKGFVKYIREPESFNEKNYEKQLVELISEFEHDDRSSLIGALQVLKKAERTIDSAPIYTIHSFCNKALNRIYAFEAGEAFENEFVIDISKYQKEASESLWRYLFYPLSKRQKLIQEEILESNDGYSLFLKYNSYLEKVALPDKSQGFLGYNIINTPLAVKGDSAIETLDLIVDYLENNGTSQKVIDCFQSIFLPDKNCEPRSWFKYVYDRNSSVRNGIAFDPCEERRLLASSALDFLEAVDMALDNVSQIDTSSLMQASKGLLSKEKDDDFRYFVDGRYIRSESSKAVVNWHEFKNACSKLADFARKCCEITQSYDDIRTFINLVVVMCIRDRIELLCRQNKIIYSNDVLTRLDHLLNGSDAGDSLAKLLRQRYRVAMIDEFQDTDPVQFNIFKKLYLNDEAQEDGSVCYLIGDPKQSIYEFRGSDINSYLKARHLVENMKGGPSGQRVKTLNTNYRSVREIIESVNAIFSDDIAKAGRNTFISDKISYSQVGYAAKDQSLSDSSVYDIAKNGTHFIYIDGAGKSKARDLKLICARKAAIDILHLLNHGSIAKGESIKQIKPSDIAVLVSSGSENELIASELEKLNIPSVYYSDSQSVLLNAQGDGASEEARCIIYLMDAMIEPTSRSVLNRLLGSRILGLDTAEFVRSWSEEHYEKEIELLNKCRMVWEKSGFLSAFALWYLDVSHECLKRRLKEHNGLRCISNFYQIAELVQGVHNSLSGAQAQKRYLVDLIDKKDETMIAGSGTFEKRLDTQRDQVRVLTIHKSKGLEFPIVVMPFLWFKSVRREKVDSSIIPYYDEINESYVIGFNAKKSDESRERAGMQELRRLLYVALTRARYANYLYAVNVEDVKNYIMSPLSVILSGNASNKGSTSAVLHNIDSFCQFNDSILFRCYELDKVNSSYVQLKPYSAGSVSDSEYTYGVFDRSSIDRRFVFTSYTAITRSPNLSDSHKNKILKNDENDKSDIFATYEYKDDDSRSAVLDMFDGKYEDTAFFNNLNYPRGAVFGTIMHNIFENTAFERIAEGGLVESVADIVTREGDSNAIALKKTWLYACPDCNYRFYSENCINALNYWFDKASHQDLLGIENKHYSLSDLKKGDYIPEMQFLMPCSSFPIKQFNELCKQEALRVFKDSSNISFIEGMELADSDVDGYLNGSLDLVLRFNIGGAYKYYVLDYKSNYLGDKLSDYRRENIARTMFNEHHRYDVQYLLYSVVLHRYLKLRLASYDYEKNFGGVLYLFVRGMGHDSSHGVFHTKPELRLVQKIEELMYD